MSRAHASVSGLFGLTIREYFAAHAPAEPAEWFAPKMATPKPEVPPQVPHTWPQEWKNQLEGLDDWLGEDHVAPEVLAHARARTAALDALLTWENERRVIRYAQWPWAWADLVMSGEVPS